MVQLGLVSIGTHQLFVSAKSGFLISVDSMPEIQ